MNKAERGRMKAIARTGNMAATVEALHKTSGWECELGHDHSTREGAIACDSRMRGRQ